nr:hypothetical protein [Tanacetum cinerariifolium]
LIFFTAARRVKTVAPRPNLNSKRPQTTQDLMIILIQRVQRLERKLKARTLIHKVDRGRSRIANLALQGGSGEGYGSLPTDFGVVEGTKRGEKVTTRIYTLGASGSNSGKQRTVICYNCKGEGHMSKQCTKPKRKQDDAWSKDKVLLVQAQANGQILYEEKLAFLADPRIPEGQATKTVITYNVAYQVDNLDAYDSDCDELNTTKVGIMANLFHNGLDVLAEVHNPDNIDNIMINQSVQVMSSSKQSSIVNHSKN